MAKKIKKKTKIKFIPVLVFLLLIIIVSFLVSFSLKVKIKNIYVTGNNIITDEEIINLSGIGNYPSFIKTSTFDIKKKLLSNSYIKDVTVSKKFPATININVLEYVPLFIKQSDKKVVVDIDREFISSQEVLGIPILLNYVPDTIYGDFINEMKNTDNKIRRMISQIEYVPNEYDKQRFLLYMDDGNLVYVTITRFELINTYNEIYPKLNGKKGILYLDSGNHFEIKG